eukprot:399504-Amphidinium_carterae.1
MAAAAAEWNGTVLRKPGDQSAAEVAQAAAVSSAPAAVQVDVLSVLSALLDRQSGAIEWSTALAAAGLTNLIAIGLGGLAGGVRSSIRVTKHGGP